MLNKIMVRIEYAFIIFLLILGLLVSSIGVTWCRYQVSTSKPITFKVKGVSEYYISNQQEWEYNYDEAIYESSFQVLNTLSREVLPVNTSKFHVRLSVSEQVIVCLYLQDLSGNEMKYQSKVYKQENGVYEYGFVDEDHELELELEGNAVSIANIRLEMQGTTEAFLSEIMIIDASYDMEMGQYYSSGAYIPLEVTSNYLSDTLEHVAYIRDTTEITLESNMAFNSVVSIETSSDVVDASVNNGESINLPIIPGSYNSVFLDVGLYEDEEFIDENPYVYVYWKLYDDNNVLVKTYKAKFFIKNDEVVSGKEPKITTSVSRETFNQYTPVELNITSDVDTVVSLTSDYMFPAATKYSLDEGKSWFILPEEDMIELSLKEQTTQKVIIDFKDARIQWTEEVYNMYTYYNEDILVDSVELMKTVNDIELLEITNHNLGILLSNEKVSFGVNTTKNISIALEYYENNQYKEVNKDDYLYLTINNENQTVELIAKENIPVGKYRMKLSQNYNNTVICEKYLSFFVIDTQA